MLDITTRADELVAKGVVLLDMQGPPNWRSRISLRELSIRDSLNCVLGQIYGDFESGCEALGLSECRCCGSSSQPLAEYYGFNGSVVATCSDLNSAWRKALA